LNSARPQHWGIPNIIDCNLQNNNNKYITFLCYVHHFYAKKKRKKKQHTKWLSIRYPIHYWIAIKNIYLVFFFKFNLIWNGFYYHFCCCCVLFDQAFVLVYKLLSLQRHFHYNVSLLFYSNFLVTKYWKYWFCAWKIQNNDYW
jgi:hypothetical protein